jgi:hypothetical protein
MKISHHTYRDGRRELLIAARQYLAWSRSEPSRRDFHLAWRRQKQRQLAQLRAATIVVVL